MTTLVLPEQLVKTEVVENIFMSIPMDFRPMTDDEIAGKYFSMQRPVSLYTDYNQLVDIGVNKSVSNWPEQDLTIMMSFQKSNIYNLYDKVEMISEGSKEVNKRQFAYFEFVSTVNADKDSFKNKTAIVKYTYIQYVIYKGQTWVFNFTCPASMKDKWQADAAKIMNSVIIKGAAK